MNRHIFITVLALSFTYMVSAQQQQIEGRVVTFKSFPLKGVVVKAKKSGDQAITDSLGYFSIAITGNDMLRIKPKGFQGTSYSVKGTDQTINLIYMDNEWAYKQVLANENITKENLDYALENYRDINNNYELYNDIFTLIQAVYPQAKIDNSSGEKMVYFNARGAASVVADSRALLVVDGIITQNISGILPAQVSSINVITGADATSYGSRGAGGIVEITLKSK